MNEFKVVEQISYLGLHLTPKWVPNYALLFGIEMLYDEIYAITNFFNWQN